MAEIVFLNLKIYAWIFFPVFLFKPKIINDKGKKTVHFKKKTKSFRLTENQLQKKKIIKLSVEIKFHVVFFQGPTDEKFPAETVLFKRINIFGNIRNAKKVLKFTQIPEHHFLYLMKFLPPTLFPLFFSDPLPSPYHASTTPLPMHVHIFWLFRKTTIKKKQTNVN